jgi:hypothetical protein
MQVVNQALRPGHVVTGHGAHEIEEEPVQPTA